MEYAGLMEVEHAVNMKTVQKLLYLMVFAGLMAEVGVIFFVFFAYIFLNNVIKNLLKILLGKRCLIEGCRKPAYERNGNLCAEHFNPVTKK